MTRPCKVCRGKPDADAPLTVCSVCSQPCHLPNSEKRTQCSTYLTSGEQRLVECKLCTVAREATHSHRVQSMWVPYAGVLHSLFGSVSIVCMWLTGVLPAPSLVLLLILALHLIILLMNLMVMIRAKARILGRREKVEVRNLGRRKKVDNIRTTGGGTRNTDVDINRLSPQKRFNT